MIADPGPTLPQLLRETAEFSDLSRSPGPGLPGPKILMQRAALVIEDLEQKLFTMAEKEKFTERTLKNLLLRYE